MKAAQIFKPVAFTTALGVFLTGCGGGPDNTSGTGARVVTPSTPISSTPSVGAVSSGGSGTYVSGTATPATPNITGTKTNGNDPASVASTLDKTYKQAASANKNSSSAKTYALAGMGIVAAGLLGFGASRIVGRSKERAAAKAAGATDDEIKEAGRAALYGGSRSYRDGAANAKRINKNTNDRAGELSTQNKDIQTALELQLPEILAASDNSGIAAGASTDGLVIGKDTKKIVADSKAFNEKSQESLSKKVDGVAASQKTAIETLVAINQQFKDLIDHKLKSIDETFTELRGKNFQIEANVTGVQNRLITAEAELKNAKDTLEALKTSAKKAATKDELEALDKEFDKKIQTADTNLGSLRTELTKRMKSDQENTLNLLLTRSYQEASQYSDGSGLNFALIAKKDGEVLKFDEKTPFLATEAEASDFYKKEYTLDLLIKK